MEALPEARGTGAQLRRQGGEDLQPGGRDDGPQAELGRRSGQPGEEDSLGLFLGQAGEARPVALDEPDATVRAALRVDGHAGCCQGLHVPMDGADRDLQLLGDLRGRQAAPRLEQEQDGDEAARAHRVDHSR